MTSDIDEEGFFILRNHHLVHFNFSGIKQTDLEHFIPENMLFELVFSAVAESEATGQFTVALESAMGGDLCGSFTATLGEVTAVEACSKDGQAG